MPEIRINSRYSMSMLSLVQRKAHGLWIERNMRKAWSQMSKRKKRLLVIVSLIFIIIIVIPCATAVSIRLRYIYIENGIKREKPEFKESKWFYNALTRKEQLLYDKIIEAAHEFLKETEMLKYGYSANEFENVLNAIGRDEPLLFYIDVKNSYCMTDSYKTHVVISYHDDIPKIKTMIMNLEAVAAAASAYAFNKESEFEKELALHDFLVKNCKYITSDDKEGRFVSTAYGALVEKEADCGAYAKAIKLLLDRNGIESIVVGGKAGGERHLWNIVKIDGAYCHLDASWNDGDIHDDIYIPFHAYFNLTDEMILYDHFVDEKIKLPECTEDRSYYLLTEVKTDSISEFEDIAHRLIIEAIENKETYIELYPDFASDSDSLRLLLLEVIDRINAVAENELLRAVRIFETSQNSNAVTIQIFYKVKS